jgi:hypothetical protein
MDVFSFDMLCFWLLFAAGFISNLPFHPNRILESSQMATFELCEPEKNLLQLWKRDQTLVKWVCWLVHEDDHVNSSIKSCLITCF